MIGKSHEYFDLTTNTERIGHWTKERGKSPRLYPGSLVWCARKPGRELREKVELWLAWQEQGAPLLPYSVSRPSLGNYGRMT